VKSLLAVAMEETPGRGLQLPWEQRFKVITIGDVGLSLWRPGLSLSNAYVG
jgi:hypothetical protein